MRFERSFPLLLLGSIISFVSSPSWGQTVEAGSTGKGIVGGALLGGEVVLLTEAAFDISPHWLYYLGGGLGAGGGAVGGYFLEDSLSSKANTFLLAGGMLLVIPTTVAVLSATAYEPSEEVTEDRGVTAESQPGAMAGRHQSPSNQARARASATMGTHVVTGNRSIRTYTGNTRQYLHRPIMALIGVTPSHLGFGLPAVELRPAYSLQEIAWFGVKQRPELRVPVLEVTF